MPKRIKKETEKKTGPSKGVAYLTVQALERAVNIGTKDEKSEAFAIFGYTIKEIKGWVVKEYENGTVEKISKIETVNRSSHLALD
jgi:hypothetical protein